MASRTWFITGTSSGFGRHITELLLARGDRVAATARKLEAIDDLVATYGDRVWVASLDVTDTAAVRQVVDDAFAALGRIDVIVNNAGYGLFGAAEELRDDQIVHQLNTNLLGSIQVTRAVLPHLRAQGGGRIIQLASMGGQMAFPGMSLYHATKWGIEGFFESVIPEVAPFNIQVTLVEPGVSRTNFGTSSAVQGNIIDAYEQTTVGDLRRGIAAGLLPALGDPEKIAQAIIASVDQEPAPRRLALGRDAYENISNALHARLDAIEAQKDLAFSTDTND